MGLYTNFLDTTPACAQRQQERPPAVVGLGVDGVEPQKAPVASRARADGGHERGGLHAAGVPALDVCGVEPGNQRNGYRERKLTTSVGTINLRIPKLRAGSYFPEDLIERYSRADRAVVAAVSEMVTNGVSTRKVKRVAQSMGIDRMSASQVSRMCSSLDESVADLQERDLSDVSYPYVCLAGLVGLGVHDLVDERLGHDPDQLRHVDHAVVESRHQGRIGRHFVYRVHMRLLPFFES